MCVVNVNRGSTTRGLRGSLAAQIGLARAIDGGLPERKLAQRGKVHMRYEIDLASVQREIVGSKASVIYKFRIASGLSTAYCDVLMTDGGIEVIENRGKDPETAARIALERLLRGGRDPFAGSILIKIPFGHAAHFAKYGNYESLPILTD